VLTRQNPVLMIFEDAHWTDPTTLELFGRVVDRVRGLRVLLIMTFRPDFDPPWVGRPYVTFLAINRLGEREILAMIEGVIGNKPLPANIRQDIIERTDGIPLFVEEVTKAVLEAESQGAVEDLAATVPPSALAVPASLQASLMARLDRLGPAKELAQIGAAIGREFSLSILAAVVRKPETDIWRSTVSFTPGCCSGRECRRMRPVCLSMRWCRMRLTARCCASRDECFMLALPKLLKTSSRRLRRSSPRRKVLGDRDRLAQISPATRVCAPFRQFGNRCPYEQLCLSIGHKSANSATTHVLRRYIAWLRDQLIATKASIPEHARGATALAAQGRQSCPPISTFSGQPLAFYVIVGLNKDEASMTGEVPVTEEVAVERAAATGRAVEASLEEFLTFERLLADLSARLANVSVAEVETEIDSALRELQEFLGFDRSNLFEFTADGWATIVCSISRDAVERHPLGPAPAFLKWYLGQVRAGKIMRVQSIEDLPREGTEQIEYHRRVGIRSSLGLPLRIGGRIVGAITFAAFRPTRKWPDDLIARLKVVGGVMAQTLMRKRAETALQASEERWRSMFEASNLGHYGD
jgi:hypothetical protein